MAYLVSKYAKNDSLYPKDPKERAIVDQMMYFDSGLFSNLAKCYVRIDVLKFFKSQFINYNGVCDIFNKINSTLFPFSRINSSFPCD